VFAYNLFDLKRYCGKAVQLAPEAHAWFDFKYDGPGPGKGGTGCVVGDGKQLDRKTIPHTMPLRLTFFETFDVGAIPVPRG